MGHKTLSLPHHTDVSMTIKDTLSINVTEDCNWCFTPKDVFGKDFLSEGRVNKRATPYGPYSPAKPGEVCFDAKTPPTTHCVPDCNRTGHTITVSSR